jgi:hypothetical protein
MEINLKQLSTQAIESTTGSKKMRLSENAQSMVFMLFTKNVYSNPIGTIVREITSNCFDSHVEAKVSPKVPVVIRKSQDKDSGQYHISFIDYGVGMSPERIENIYMVYFESTKRVDNTQIGGFGIGGKTPLAYKRYTGVGEGEYDNSFYVITTYEGIKYYYCIYEGAESPVVSLLHQEATKEHNGTEIRVPVLEKDLYTFEKEMVRQLYYFENVVFEGFDGTSSRYESTLTNEYKIVRGKSFLFRGLDYSSGMHACLGRVAYPIDYATLGLNSSDYYLPVAVRLEIGEVNVTVSREQLDYSEATIKILKKKLAEAKAEITELLAKQYSNIVTLEDYFNVKNEFGKLKFANGVEVNVGNLIKQSDVDFSNFTYNFMKMPNDRQLFKFFFTVKSYGKKPARSRYSKYEFEGGYKELQQNSNLLYVEDEFVRKVVKQAYLKQEYDLYHIIEKRNLCAGFIKSEVAELFNTHLDKVVDENGKPVAFVQSLIDMQEEYMSIVRNYAKDYDTLEIPDDFVARRKKKGGMSEEIRNSTIPVRFVGRYGSERVKLAHLFDYNMPIFYGGEEDEYKLNKAVEMYNALFDNKAVVTGYSTWNTTDVFTNGYTSYNRKSDTVKPVKKSIMFIRLAKNNLKYMEYCKRAKKVDDFYTEMLVRKENKVLAFFQTYDLVNSWDDVGSMYKEKNFEKISPAWHKKIKEISDYIKALPTLDSTNIGYLKDQLSKYFDLSNTKKTAEQKRIEKMISEVKQLQKANETILSYINYRYDYELKDEKLVHILKRVMVL